MPYSRSAAIAYAQQFWNRPCDDGVFWLTDREVSIDHKRRELSAPAKDGWQPFFISDGHGAEQAVFQKPGAPDIFIQGWAGLADCAHFLSKCLQAGGIRVFELSVPKLVHDLQVRSDTKTLAEKVSQDRGQRIIDSGFLKSGDMIGYFNVSPTGDYGGAQEYSHSTMYVGKLNSADPGRITCHTICRFAGLSFTNDEWYLHPGYVYTFIHFSSDDPMPAAAIANTLAGWWKVDYSGRTEYYFIHKDGRAHYVNRRPVANRPIQMGEGSAYWYAELGKVSFLWRKTGTIDVWSPGATPNDYRIVVNGSAPGTGVRLF